MTTLTTSAGSARGNLTRTVWFEWTKTWSVRATTWTFLATVALLPVMAVFVAVTGSLQPDDTVLGASLTAAPLSLVVAAAFGALGVTGEYKTGLITTTLVAAPVRSRVVMAKTLVTAGSLFVATLPAAAVAFLIGRWLLDPGYAMGEPWPALVGVAAHLATAGALGIAIGLLLRHSGGAISAIVAIALLPGLLGPLFGDLQPWVAGASPIAALEKMTQTSDALPQVVGTLGAWPSLAITVATTAALVVVAGWRLRSRDA